MPPGQPPSQAGKFKPRKPPPKRKSTSSSSSPPAAAAASSPPPASTASSSNSPGRGERGGRGRGRDGDGRGRGGRDGRGRGGRGGRGRGRVGGRINAQGAVFFTGDAVKPDAVGSKNKAVGKDAAVSQPRDESTVAVGLAGSIIMPGGGGSGGVIGARGRGAQSAAQSDLAAAEARRGEGEEIIIGELEGGGIGSGKDAEDAKERILDRMSASNNLPSLFEDDEEDDADVPLSAYTYDSDSSLEEAKAMAAAKRADMRRLKKGYRERQEATSVPPARLPFPPPPMSTGDIRFMYKTQIPPNTATTIKPDEAKSSMSNDNEETTTAPPAKDNNTDPELTSPFLNLSISNKEQKKAEVNSWIKFKFPTRLPQLHPQSTQSGMRIKNEFKLDPDADDDSNDGGGDMMDVDSQTKTEGGVAAEEEGGGGRGTSGYDDTLKDAAPGKYGRILVYESGKTIFVVGGEDGSPEVRMNLTEGLQCGFLQQAVVIDPDEGQYIPLGEIKKSLTITPDIDKAFSS